MVKFSRISLALMYVLFAGECMEIIGKYVIVYTVKFAFPKLTKCVPATAENRSAEMEAAVKRVFFSTGNPCLILGRFRCKSVFVKVS